MIKSEYLKEYYRNNKLKLNKYSKEYRRKNGNKLNRKRRGNRKENPKKYYFIDLKSKYGVTEKWFYNQLKAQNGKCICGFKFKLFTRDRISTPHVDHCHKTNRIRGLLCQKCNTAIGLLKLDERTKEESIRLFSTILDYLRA